MKKITGFFLAAIFSTASLYAQTPQAFQYQAVVRDNSGVPIANQDVNFQIDIIKSSVDGSAVYSETHAARTSDHGLVTLEIGKGTSTDDFSSLDWGSDAHFIKVSMDGNEMGTTQLLSVPYALHAHSTDVFTGNQLGGLEDPTDDQDAATKAYVDMQITNPGIRINGTVTDVTCYGKNTGSVNLDVAGGTPPYEFEWSNDSTTEDMTGLEAGKYQIYVVDMNGMSSFRQFKVAEPEEISMDYTTDFGTGTIDVSVTGGIQPYTYLWSNGSTTQDLIGVTQGIYTLEVTDANECTLTAQTEMVKESILLAEYLESIDSPSGGDYVNTSLPSIRTAEHVKTLQTIEKVYIIDIRNAVDYAIGHIEGAVNVPISDVMSHIDFQDLSNYDEVSIVGYSGQASAWITTLLQLMGYENVYSLKFGMCSWHQDFASNWNNNVGNGYTTMFTNDPSLKGPAGDLPEINTGGSSVQEILEARVQVALSEGFSTARVTNSTVFADLENYYIVNYWPESDYLDMGHIPGAIQYTPKASMMLSADLKTLPRDKTIAVYDYTGQVSCGLVAYLRLLGYDAKAITWGTNGMIYDNMTKSKWSEAAIMNYEYVTSK